MVDWIFGHRKKDRNSGGWADKCKAVGQNPDGMVKMKRTNRQTMNYDDEVEVFTFDNKRIGNKKDWWLENFDIADELEGMVLEQMSKLKNDKKGEVSLT